jgi:glutathione S-transferase
MRLYQHPMSANARAAIMTVYLLDAPVEFVFVDLQNQEQTLPAFLKKNPNHRVPVLEDGDFYLWESRAIMQYLADTTAEQTLYPTRAARARRTPLNCSAATCCSRSSLPFWTHTSPIASGYRDRP